MALRDFHPCDYGFQTSNIRIIGSAISGGRSLSGFEDTVQSDGGGFRAVDLTNGEADTRESNMAIRALVDEVGTAKPFIVRLCVERHFQPILDRFGGPPNTPIADDAPDKGASFTAAAASLRATSIILTGNSERPIIGGELFSINHPNWGWRVYRISLDGMAADGTIHFNTPLREAITAGTAIEFDNVRCQMKFAQAPDLSTDMGLWTPLSLTLVEDMSRPAS